LPNIDFTAAALGFGVLLLSLTVHEAAHAWTADKLGDRTARALGRVSLNPVVHIDPAGTIILPLIAIFTNLPIIGWAKPVPVNSRNLRNPRRDFVLVAAAGPISNLLQACLAAVLLRALVFAHPAGATPGVIDSVLYLAIEINVLLAFFNLLLYALLLTGAATALIMPPTNLVMRVLLP
jgi:Zn-dependent protease